MTKLFRLAGLLLLILLAGCADVPRADGLSAAEAAALESLKQVDDYPLYTMHITGAYPTDTPGYESQAPAPAGGRASTTRNDLPAWACSLFAALADPANRLYGRNFDWQASPAVLLFTDPPDGYASVAMVDISYLGFKGEHAHNLDRLSLVERRALLAAPWIPFDGLNERGLAVGMAAVPPGEVRPDPGKETVGSLGLIRRMLDSAATVDEAVALLRSYNVDFEGGPPLHYLIADRSGRSALVEFYRGEVVVLPNEVPWQVATNFLRAAAGDSAEGQSDRYDRLTAELQENGGRLSAPAALELLAGVAQGSTQWSIVYGLSTGEVTVAMGRQYDSAHTFQLPLE